MTNKQELSAFDSTAAGSTSTNKVDIFQRRIHGIAIQSVHTTPATVRDIVADVEYVLVKFGSNQELLITPDEMRKLVAFLNATDDTIPNDYLWIPWTRLGIFWSPLGTGDIPEMLVQVKLKTGLTNFAKLRGFIAYSPTDAPVVSDAKFVQTTIPVTNVVAGWNTISDLPYKDIVAVTHLLLNADAITQVKVSIGTEQVYDMTKRDQAFELALSPLYKLPATMDSFPIIMDSLGDPGEYQSLLRNGIRRDLKIEFYWDTGVAAVAPFNILAIGVKRGAQKPVATAAA